MKEHQSLDSLSPRRKVVVGLFVAAIGLAVGALVVLRPEQLRAPAWVAIVACLSFVLAGVAIAVHSFVSARFYLWCVVGVLAAMTAIPMWIALGPGSRRCSVNMPIIASELGCRAAFGLGALVLLAMLWLAVAQAQRAANAP